jgi:drug/metabolite transporter (DMT)-like permease
VWVSSIFRRFFFGYPAIFGRCVAVCRDGCFWEARKARFQGRDAQALPGILLITLGNGIIGWAEMYIPSGLAALIVCIMPIYIVIINLISGNEQKRFNFKTIAGFVLGCVGIVLILRTTSAIWAIRNTFGAC